MKVLTSQPLYIFRKLAYQWQWAELCQRKVMVRRLETDKLVCADCGRTAQYNVMERNGDTWCYCGLCEVG